MTMKRAYLSTNNVLDALNIVTIMMRNYQQLVNLIISTMTLVIQHMYVRSYLVCKVFLILLSAVHH